MKNGLWFFALLLFAGDLFFSCQKEISFENGAVSKGTLLQNSSGDCGPIHIGGIFIANQSLADSNFIEVSVHVLSAGRYTITSDTVNGYSFKANGNFSDTGQFVVRLNGSGKPS